MLEGQKSSKMETFSKHEKHEKSMAGAAHLRLEGDQKSIQIEAKKKGFLKSHKTFIFVETRGDKLSKTSIRSKKY